MTIQYPDQLPDVLQETREEFESGAKFALYAKLFELKKISSGMAASMLGISRAEFLHSLEKYGVSMIGLDTGDIITEMENAGF